MVGSTSLTIEEREKSFAVLYTVVKEPHIVEVIGNPKVVDMMIEAFPLVDTHNEFIDAFGFKLTSSNLVPCNKVLLSDGERIVTVINL